MVAAGTGKGAVMACSQDCTQAETDEIAKGRQGLPVTGAVATPSPKTAQTAFGP